MVAHLDQASQVGQPAWEAKVLGVVEDHFSTQGATVFQVLFEGTVFVTNTDDRLNTFPQHPGVELAGSCFSHLTLEDQADPVRTAQVEIIPDQGFDQSPALFGVLEDLGAADFQLPDTQLVGITGRSLLLRQRPGKLFDPAVEKCLDLLGVQLVTNDLQTLRVLAGQKTVIQGCEADALLTQLLFGPLMPVEAYLNVKRKVGTHLDEKQPEFFVQNVEVVVGH